MAVCHNEGGHPPVPVRPGAFLRGLRTMWEPPAEHPLRRLFAGLAEHAFLSHLRVADPPLIDYLSALLSRFVHFDAVYRLRGDTGRPLTEVVDMVMQAEQLPA